MAIIKATRRTKYKREFHSSSIKSLPNELLTEVLGHVASTSFTDLFNVKLSCKYFIEVAKDDYIFQRISLDKFPIVPLRISNEASSFFKRCEEFGNPESLFRLGLSQAAASELTYGLNKHSYRSHQEHRPKASVS
ncbi:hypothetical protein SO802_006778 [Lithocarpus litseifolius]|uniref:F-box domain-containing protein n=1 Tax=Lithocarpus litseifolius TaxID=425828 RepID=A0AAW2DLV8_9ROSI